MKKRLIAVIMIVCILNSIILPSYAVSNSIDKTISNEINPLKLLSDYYGEEIYDKTLEKKITNDLEILAQFGFKGLNTEIHSVPLNGTVVYKVELLDSIVNYIDIQKIPNGDINLHFVEGEIDNNITFSSNGEILIDRHIVRITNYNENRNVLLSENFASIKAGAHRYYQNSVPVGTLESEYNTTGSVYQSTTKIDFNVDIGSLAVGAIVTILTAGLAAKVCVAYGFVSTSMFNVAANWLKNKNPYYKYASFQDIRCSRQKDSVVYHYKHNVYIWNKRDYEGEKMLLTKYYEIVEPT